ncbi:hypothetical protein HRbin14_01768 [bacterium HR14]|nr:hypothetical protein HRbin14_01768 [bacterium HR14]
MTYVVDTHTLVWFLEAVLTQDAKIVASGLIETVW